jgi:hypothetical protein
MNLVVAYNGECLVQQRGKHLNNSILENKGINQFIGYSVWKKLRMSKEL